MAIQWFPGHMTSARRKAAETMASTDVVIEVVDARIPEASTNPMIRQLREARQRACLKVLNKADLADPAVTRAWLAFYDRQPGVKAVAISCRKAGDPARIPALCQELAPHRSDGTKPLRLMIMGIPNVGKSTLMNALVKRRVAAVGDEPAITKAQQRYDLGPRTTLVDTPGVRTLSVRGFPRDLLAAVFPEFPAEVLEDPVAFDPDDEEVLDALGLDYPERLQSLQRLWSEMEERNPNQNVHR